MQTPTPPTTNRFASRATSVCSQRYPASVKSWKSRCDDDEIPSDESDFGGKRPYNVNMRTRVRKRRAISAKPGPSQAMSSGMSHLSASKCMRTQSVCVPSSSFSNVTSTTEKTVKKALFPPPASPNKSPTHVRHGSSSLHGMRSPSIHSNLGLRRGGTLKSPPRTPKGIRTPRTSPTSNPNPVADKTKLAVDWVLYSVWHPAWDIIWKCDDGKLPLSQNQYFRKLITEVLAGNMTLRDISATIDLKVIKVQDLKEDSQGKLSIIVAPEVEASGRPNQKMKECEPLKWNPNATILERLLKHVVSASDLLVQCKYPEALETGNSKGKLCFIHITPKDGKPVNSFEISKMGAHVSAYNINYDYYTPKVIKCVPFKLTRTIKNAQKPVEAEGPVDVAAVGPVDVAAVGPVDVAAVRPGDVAAVRPGDVAAVRPVDVAAVRPVDVAAVRPVDVGAEGPVDVEDRMDEGAEATSTVTVVDEARNRAKNLAAYVFSSPGTSQKSLPVPLSETRPNAAIITNGQQDEEPLDVDSEIILEQPLSPLSGESEAQMEISDKEELLDVGHKTLPSGRAPLKRKNDFNLTSFLTRGEFVPGPLRPKVKKPDRPYVYHTLKELSDMLQASIAEDEARGVVPNMLIKHQCNTYGIVVEKNNQTRHENAYYVRISDETMNSVLLRIHTGVDQSPGPRIELGNIIRIHRLTAQNEWDAGEGENTMVLSTPAHHNYVVFDQSKEKFQFYYNTCAKTVTFSDTDRKRVGELHLYKSKIDIPESEEVPLPPQKSGVAPVALDEPPEDELVSEHGDDSIPVVPARNSDGICDSDLASPCVSETSIGDDDSQSNSESMFDESCIQAISNSRSDESFFSATSDMDLVGDTNLSPMRYQKSADSSLGLNTVQPKRSSQNITFTLFKDLKITTNPINLLCQIVSLNEHRNGIWCLILKDLEQTVPSGDFKQPQSSVANPSGFHLGVNIINVSGGTAEKGIGLEKRDLLYMLVESQGTDEFYFIPNVSVKGTHAPYTLEIDGNSCVIRRFKHLSRFLDMDDTFSIRSAPSSSADPQQGASSNTIPDDNVLDEQQEMIEIEDVNTEGSVATGSNINNPSAEGEDSDDDIVLIAEIPSSRSSQSDFETAWNTPSQSPAKGDQQGSPMMVGTPAAAIPLNKLVRYEPPPVPVQESWTGRLRGRRKPLQHYQPEDSFEC